MRVHVRAQVNYASAPLIDGCIAGWHNASTFFYIKHSRDPHIMGSGLPSIEIQRNALKSLAFSIYARVSHKKLALMDFKSEMIKSQIKWEHLSKDAKHECGLQPCKSIFSNAFVSNRLSNILFAGILNKQICMYFHQFGVCTYLKQRLSHIAFSILSNSVMQLLTFLGVP
jgi:hypothetical protein